MTPATIKNVFQEHCNRIVPDQNLANRLKKLQIGFVNKNKNHIEFFGGNLTGVQPVKFMPADKDLWFDLILESDEQELKEQLHSLNSVNPDYVVSSDPMNLSVVYILHLLYRSNKLSLDQKNEAMIDALLYLQFKFLTSLLYRYFQYPAKKETAEATYAQLTNKFSIKIYGSWIEVLKARSRDIISPDTSIHFDTIANMESDEKVLRMVADIQGRIRDMLKNIYAVFIQVHRAGDKIASTSSVVEHDGVEVLKDHTRGLIVYTNYLKSIVSDRNSFIRSELLRVIEDISPAAPPKLTLATLEYITKHYSGRGSDDIGQFLESVMLHSFSYLQNNKTTITSNPDLASLLIRLRGIYTSSRSSDPELLNLRAITEKIVKRAIDTKTDSVVASVLTSVLLYVIARTYTMRHYTSGG
jgi:hypothetical protein